MFAVSSRFQLTILAKRIAKVTANVRQQLELEPHYATRDNFRVVYIGTDYKFLLVDGVAYYVTSPVDEGSVSEIARCLDAGTIPPLNDIVGTLNEATAIASVSASDETIKYSSGDLFKVSFGGADFALCASGASGLTIFGSDLDTGVEYLDDPVEISAPALDEAAAAACEAVVTPTAVTATTLALLTGDTISSDIRRKLN